MELLIKKNLFLLSLPFKVFEESQFFLRIILSCLSNKVILLSTHTPKISKPKKVLKKFSTAVRKAYIDFYGLKGFFPKNTNIIVATPFGQQHNQQQSQQRKAQSTTQSDRAGQA